MSTAVCVLHCTFDVDSDGMFIVLLSHSMTRNFCSHNYNTVFFRLCHSLNINYNSGKLSPSRKLCLNITDLISWLSGEKKWIKWSKHCFSQEVEYCAHQLETRQTSVIHYQSSSMDWMQSSVLQQTALLNPMFEGQGVSSASTQTFEKTADEIK